MGRQKYILLDTETTGLYAGDRQVTALGCIVVTRASIGSDKERGRLTKSKMFSSRVRPNFTTRAEWDKYDQSVAAQITGLYSDKLKKAHKFRHVWREFKEFLKREVGDRHRSRKPVIVVAHNMAFDTAVLREQLYDYDLSGDKLVKKYNLQSVDSLAAVKHIDGRGGRRASYKLGLLHKTVCGRAVHNSRMYDFGAHNVMGDCRMLLDVVDCYGTQFIDYAKDNAEQWQL